MEQALYQHRFDNLASRQQLWQTLVENFFQDLIDPNSTVVDLACGYGEFINAIQAKHKYGIDLNPDSVNQLNPEITFFQTKASDTPLKKETADTVFISNFFEHIDKTETVKTIKEIARITRHHGQVIILQPNIRYCYRDYWRFFDHITPVDDRALTEIFSCHNFKLKKLIRRFLPYTTKSKLPQTKTLIKLYLKLPVIWPLVGQQSLLIFERL